MATYSIKTFQEALNGKCTLRPDGDTAVQAELVEVTSLHESKDEQAHQFSVLWKAPKETRLDQNICTVELPGGESHDLFLVPVGEDADSLTYEAVFA